MLMALTVRVSYSPSRAVDIPWGEYLYMQHEREQARQREALGRFNMPLWKYSVKFNETGGMTIRQRWVFRHRKRLIRIALMVSMLLITYYLGTTPIAIPLANRYFVGTGTGAGARWNRTANWSTSSGGAGGAAVPTSSDAVIYDTNSGTCELNIDASCLSFAADGAFTGDFDTAGFEMTVTNAYTNAGTGTITQGSGVLTVGTFSWTGSGTFENFGIVRSGGNFTASGTWSDTGGCVSIIGNCTWNASITTTLIEWDVPGGTITVTGGNTIVVVDSLTLEGSSGSHLTITAASNFTIDLGASISFKSAVHSDIDHMQLGAGDVLTVFSGTDNGNNDADITFSAYDRIANATGAFDDNAKWDGGNAPVSGVSFDIPATIVMTLQGNEASAGGSVSGTLTMDGQADSAVAQLTIDGGETIDILDGGTLDTTGTGSTGYAKLGSSDATPSHCHGAGTVTLGTEFHLDTVHVIHTSVGNGEKVILDGDCTWHDGFTIASGGEIDDGGNTLTVDNGNLTIPASGYTATGTLILAGTHSLDGAGLSFNIVQVGTSPGVTTLEANLSGVDLTIAGGDELDTNTFNVTMTGDVDVTGTFTGSTGTHAHGSLTGKSGGVYSATTGNTTITSETAGGNGIQIMSGSTITNNNGTFIITTVNPTNIRMDGTGNLYNLIVNHATANPFLTPAVTIENDLTVTLGELDTSTNALTVTGDVDLTGKLDMSAASAAGTFGSLTINSGGTYSATSGTTTITSETSAGFAFVLDAAGTLTHNSGTFSFTLNSTSVIKTSAAGNTIPFYNLNIDTGSSGLHIVRNADVTVAGNFTLDDGQLSLDSSVGFGTFTVTGTSTIGDGAGAASSAKLVCNSSDVDLNGAWTVDTDGELSLPDASGSFLWGAGSSTVKGVITANGGTLTYDGTAQVILFVHTDTTFYNITNASPNDRVAILNVDASVTVTIQNALTALNSSYFSMASETTPGQSLTIVMGTTTSSGTMTSTSHEMWLDENGGGIVIRAASPDYPIIVVGPVDWDWGFDAGSVAIQDIDYRIAATTGGGGVTITMTRCKFPLGMFISSGDTIKLPENTSTGFLKVEGGGTLQCVKNGRPYILNGIGDTRPPPTTPGPMNPPNIVCKVIQGVES